MTPPSPMTTRGATTGRSLYIRFINVPLQARGWSTIKTRPSLEGPTRCLPGVTVRIIYDIRSILTTEATSSCHGVLHMFGAERSPKVGVGTGEETASRRCESLSISRLREYIKQHSPTPLRPPISMLRSPAFLSSSAVAAPQH